jgi:acyl-CoA synthetase (AMP-forming)/AMP-acid ligase II
MIQLIDLIKRNQLLKYIDAETGEVFDIKTFTANVWLTSQKKQLAFLYLDNSLLSVKILLTFLDSPHTFVLLNPSLNDFFKLDLEKQYQPDFIFDIKRDSIEKYETLSFMSSQSIFNRIYKIEKQLDPKLKILLTTSGTTGSPKLVKLSEENIIANAKSIINYLPINANDITPLNLSIFYSYGLSVFTSNSIACSTIVCTNKDILNKEFWSDFETYGYTSLAGVPYVYEMLNRIGFLKKNYSSLRYMTQAGGKLNTKLIELFHQHLKLSGKLFFVMYGQTEATARMSYLPPNKLHEKYGSIGIPISNGKFTIDQETNELIYEGPNVFGGYANSLEDLLFYENYTTLKTGDIAYVDEDGFYYITGRLKRFVKIFGTRTNLDEIENILKNQFFGNLFYTIGTDDEKLVIFLTNTKINQIEIKKFLKEKMQIHPSIIIIKIINEVPLTSNGKINYLTLKNYA